MALGRPGQAGHGLDFGVGEAGAGGPLPGEVDPDHGVALDPQLDGLVRDLSAGDLPQDLVDQVVVRRHLARDHRLAQAPAGIDGHLGAVPVAGVEGEGHPRGDGPHHLLHAHAHGHRGVGVPRPRPVADRPGRPQAGPAPQDVAAHVLGAVHPQEAVVLAGEAGVGGVLAGGRGAHRHRHPCDPAFVAQPVVGDRHRLGHLGGQGCGLDAGPHHGRDLLQRGRVRQVSPGEQVLHVAGHLGPGQVGGEGPRGDGEAGRHGQSGPGHLPQAGVLAAHQRQELRDVLIEWHHVVHRLLPPPMWAARPSAEHGPR